MPFFTKKPVRIEARQYQGTPDSAAWITAWIADCNNSVNPNQVRCYSHYDPDIEPYGELTIHTLEGQYVASPGDWIIKGVHNEFYPCKPDIFEKTYEDSNN